MEEGEAISLLLKAANEDQLDNETRALAKLVVEELGYLALAIDQAGAYIGNVECDLANYLEVYRERRKDLLNDSRFKGSSDYGYVVYTTWELSFSAIEEGTSDSNHAVAKVASNALELLQIFGFLHHEGIFDEIFRRAAENEEPKQYSPETDPHGDLGMAVHDLLIQLLQKENGKWDYFSFKKAISLLASFSLVKVDRMKTAYTIYSLVYSWIRERLSLEEYCAHSKIARSLLTCSITWELRKEDYEFRTKLLLHIDACQGFCGETMEFGGLKNVNSSKSFALVYQENGRFAEAEELRKSGMEMTKKVLGAEHPGTLISIANLAATYISQGRYGEAEELQKPVVEIMKKVLGVEHPDTQKSIANLAVTYFVQGRYGETEELQKSIMEMMEKVLDVGI